jgi:peroxiredoxin
MSKDSLLPVFTFQNTLSKEENMYLGLSRKNIFSLKDIQGNFLIIEVFSTYCTACPKNVPVLNEVYSAIENDSGLKDKVKIIGIAVGNTEDEKKIYKKEYGIQYPVMSDYKFKFHKVIGNPRVPYTIFTKRSLKGKNAIIFYTHQGILDSSKQILGIIKDAMH